MYSITKLNTLSPENTPDRSGRRSISINGNSGLISFSPLASKALCLCDGTSVLFHQDDSRPYDWYISLGATRSEFPLRLIKKEGNGERWGLRNKAIAQIILSSLGNPSESIITPLLSTSAIELIGIKGYAILTKPFVKA